MFEVVLECGKMIESYGLSIIIRDPADANLISAAVLRVKRLPEAFRFKMVFFYSCSSTTSGSSSTATGSGS